MYILIYRPGWNSRSAANADATIPGRISVRAFTRRSILLGAVAAPFAAQAQTWPAGTIRIVVPYPPAGSTDVIARLVQNDLQQRLGATVIIENRPGASGSVGTAAVAKSPPD